MLNNVKEIAFEKAIERHLLHKGGYIKGDRNQFDPARGIDPKILIDFIKETQIKEWEALYKLQKDKTEEILLDDLCKALDSEYEGCLKVLRHGFKCFGKLFRVAYFAPASGLNSDAQKLYSVNKLTVTRNLKYSSGNENFIDTVLNINGLPFKEAFKRSKVPVFYIIKPEFFFHSPL